MRNDQRTSLTISSSQPLRMPIYFKVTYSQRQCNVGGKDNVDHGSPLASFLPWVTMHNIHLSILHSERTPDIFLCRITAGELQGRPGKERGERGAKNRSCLNRGYLFLDILVPRKWSKSFSGAPSCKLLNLVFCAVWLLLERLCGQLEVPLVTALIPVHPEIHFSSLRCDSSSEPRNMHAYQLGFCTITRRVWHTASWFEDPCRKSYQR